MRLARIAAKRLHGAVVGVALLATACGPNASTAMPIAEPTAVPNAAQPSAMATRDPTALELPDRVIGPAIEALDRLDSYRVLRVDGGLDVSSSNMVVVNGPPLAVGATTTRPDSGLDEDVRIGNQAWHRVEGRAWTPDDSFDPPGGGVVEWPPPLADLPMEEPFQLPLRDAGIEQLAGVEARHWTATGDGTPIDITTDEWSMSGAGWLGTVDAWVAIDGGYLVAMHVDGRDPSVPADADPQELEGSRTVFDIRVSGIDDPANHVDEPVVPEPTPKPSGDAAVLELLTAAEAAGADLESWSITTEETWAGGLIRTVQSFVRTPKPAYAYETGDGSSAGTTSMIVIGDDGWMRSGADPWKPITPADIGCSAAMSECTLHNVAALPTSIGAERETFTLVGDETINGVRAVHLRSTAGMPAEGGNIPATVDVWLAEAGGYLLRTIIKSDDGASRTDVSRVNDPTLTIEAPVP